MNDRDTDQPTLPRPTPLVLRLEVLRDLSGPAEPAHQRITTGTTTHAPLGGPGAPR